MNSPFGDGSAVIAESVVDGVLGVGQAVAEVFQERLDGLAGEGLGHLVGPVLRVGGDEFVDRREELGGLLVGGLAEEVYVAVLAGQFGVVFGQVVGDDACVLEVVGEFAEVVEFLIVDRCVGLIEGLVVVEPFEFAEVLGVVAAAEFGAHGGPPVSAGGIGVVGFRAIYHRVEYGGLLAGVIGPGCGVVGQP